MAKQKLAGWAASSEDNTEVSKRVKGIIIGLSSVIIYVAANFFGIELTADDIVALATQVGIIAGAVTTIYGAGVMLVRRFATE